MDIIKTGGLRPQIRDTLREWIVTGHLAPEAPLRESTLSVELGVSRTPVREALAQLEQEGLVHFSPGCGFSVAPLTIEEVREVFPIVGSLQATALRSAGYVSTERIRGLRAMNEIIGSDGDPRMIVVEDIHWHGLLLSGCTNRRLLNMLDEVEAIVHRYDLAYFTEGGDAQQSASEHEGILQALEAGDIDRAASLLEAHWIGGLDWLEGCIERVTSVVKS